MHRCSAGTSTSAHRGETTVPEAIHAYESEMLVYGFEAVPPHARRWSKPMPAVASVRRSRRWCSKCSIACHRSSDGCFSDPTRAASGDATGIASSRQALNRPPELAERRQNLAL